MRESKSDKLKKSAPLSQVLELEDFESLSAELKAWRTDEEIRTIEYQKGSGLVLGFVKGLRLSAKLIYAIRKSLSGTSLEVDWGHLLNEDGTSLSPECDVIIHKKGMINRWNGNLNPIMDFKFIKSSEAVAVISCKSEAKSIDKAHKKYCEKLNKYVDNMMLFAECCPKGRVDTLITRAKEAGYKGFWYLYTIDEKTNECCNNPRVWKSFLTTLKKICGADN